MRKIRHHRKIAATSHDDLIPSNAMLATAEDKLACGLYCKKIQEVYQHCFHFAVSWDPSSYDIETMVSIVFSGQCGANGLAAYLPIQK
jgi:hypothetical protein